MHSSTRNWIATVIRVLAVVCFARGLPAHADGNAPVETGATHPLVWDGTEKTVTAHPRQDTVTFAFTVTNKSAVAVTIYQVRPTCGCTVAQLPESPWVIGAQASGTFSGIIDLRTNEATGTKALYVNSSAGTQVLRVRIVESTESDPVREQHRRVAAQNRQAVFGGECASCHATPAAGKTGAELFVAACGTCHLSRRRAADVPDLLVAREPRDAAYWRRWIANGRKGSLMPAWAIPSGGPLTDTQIESLVRYALETLPTQPRS